MGNVGAARRRWLWGLLALAPVLLVLQYAAARARNVPIGDQWDASAAIAIETHDGTLAWRDLVAQHNEHRILFTHLVTAALTKSTRWDVRLEVAVLLLLALANLWILSSLLAASEGARLLPVLVPIAWLVFSLRQHIPWQSGLMSCHFFALFFILLAVQIVQRRRPGYRALALAAPLALAATFSIGVGLLAWPVIALQLYLRGDRRLGHYALWGAAALVAAALFFQGYRLTRSPGAEPLEGLAFFLAYLGGPFAEGRAAPPLPAALVGLGGLLAWAALVLVARRAGRPRDAEAAWIALGALALASALAAAGSRAFLGLDQALRSRYVTWGSLFWISLAVLAWRAFRAGRDRRPDDAGWRRRALLAAAPLLLALAALYAVANVRAARLPPRVRAQDEACLLAFPRTGETECLRTLHVSLRPGSRKQHARRVVLERMRGLAERRLSLFARAEPAAVEAETGTPP